MLTSTSNNRKRKFASPSSGGDSTEPSIEVERNIEANEETAKKQKQTEGDEDEDVQSQLGSTGRENGDGEPNSANSVRKRAGLNLLSMETKILSEIFGQLEPLDLLCLSCASVDLRSLLKSETARLIWVRTRKSLPVPGLPECPPDISELHFASLLFNDHCGYCQEGPEGKIYTIWGCRLKACYTCLCAKFSSVSPSTFNVLKHYVPQITFSKNDMYGDKFTTTYWHTPTLKLWEKEQAKKMTDRDKKLWESDMVEKQKLIKAHGNACERWLGKWKEHWMAEGKNLVAEHLKALGWEDELKKITVLSEAPQNSHRVKQISNKRITQSGERFDILEPFLNDSMCAIQRQRLSSERVEFLRKRLPPMVDALGAFALDLPPNTPIPDIADAFFLPAFQKVINDTSYGECTAAHFEPLRATFPDIVFEWQRQMEAKLIAIITNECGEDYSFNPETVLQLATTMFMCKICKRDQGFLQYPRVMAHRHTVLCEKDSYSSIEEDVLRKDYRKARWGDTFKIRFRKNYMLILSDILTQFGFNPKTTTISQMDEADPIFECVTCNDPREGRYIMRWRMVPYHKTAHHTSKRNRRFGRDELEEPKPFNLELLEGKDVETARDRMNEANEREQASPGQYNEDSMLCAHCRKVGNSIALSSHIVEKHGITNPTKGDMVVKLDAEPILFHRLWPPRDI